MQFYDAHIHFFYEGPLDWVKKKYLKSKGCLGGAVFVMEGAPEVESVLKLVPRSYHDTISPEVIYSLVDSMQCLRTLGGLSFIPYLDIRFFLSEHICTIKHFVQKGYQGVKILYFPEKDELIGVEGWERVLGRTVSESERLVSDIVAECDRLCIPVVFHADLNRYNEYVCELISAFPNVLFSIPHFGSSRKKMTEALSRYPNCYTDFSSLLPFMKEAPETYRNFIKIFSDRVLFGSDALLGQPSVVKEYADYVKTFLEGDLLEKVAWRYFRQFHRLD
jgi:hypothetical protein